MPEPSAIAAKAVSLLVARELKIVFAESCTAGLVAATMGQVPGVSASLCGSMVTYRIPTKTQWLDLDPQAIEQHTAESQIVSDSMAQHVLSKTPEAGISAAITGHLDPSVPAEIDGLIFVAVASRHQNTQSIEYRLTSPDRISRQQEAAEFVLQCVSKFLQEQ